MCVYVCLRVFILVPIYASCYAWNADDELAVTNVVATNSNYDVDDDDHDGLIG